MTKNDQREIETAVIGKKGITVPWAWISGLAPVAALGGAIGHASLFGAPPEFAERQREDATILRQHSESLSQHGDRIRTLEVKRDSDDRDTAETKARHQSDMTEIKALLHRIEDQLTRERSRP